MTVVRLRQFDSRFAPSQYTEKAAPAGLSDDKHEQVKALLLTRTANRSPEYVKDALAFIEDWRRNHNEGYSKDEAGSIVLATILAVSIRRAAQERSRHEPPKEAPADP